ncbi:MAG: DUF1311 domain-containing protein [Alphaproteobacteria bacterium]|nr:DUF1311 domain-containing protein [Alphaproteobacteria bacterium]
MKAALAAALLAALAAPPAARWDWGDVKDDYGMEASKALCRQLRNREPPASDRPTAQQAAALKGCDSEKLYYGIGMPADPAKARQCAFLEADKGDESVFGGRTMLMMIYANGKGARQDYDVAIHLACGIEGAPAQSDGRVRDLAERRKRGEKGGDFDYCDGITSGLAAGYCASHAASIEGAKRDAVWARLTAGWPAADKQALAKLKAAHKAFAEAHAGGELDLSGTLRGAISIGAEEDLAKALLAMVERLESGKAPAYTHAQYLAADAALNARYRKALAEVEPNGGPGAVTPEGIRSAQRAWLAYRDAFLAFAALRYPKLPRDSLAAWLTAERTKMWDQPEG